MSFTRKSLALVWLLLLGLFGVAGSGAAEGSWLILLIATALVMPALISELDAKTKPQSDRDFPLRQGVSLPRPGAARAGS